MAEPHDFPLIDVDLAAALDKFRVPPMRADFADHVLALIASDGASAEIATDLPPLPGLPPRRPSRRWARRLSIGGGILAASALSMTAAAEGYLGEPLRKASHHIIHHYIHHVPVLGPLIERTITPERPEPERARVSDPDQPAHKLLAPTAAAPSLAPAPRSAPGFNADHAAVSPAPTGPTLGAPALAPMFHSPRFVGPPAPRFPSHHFFARPAFIGGVAAGAAMITHHYLHPRVLREPEAIRPARARAEGTFGPAPEREPRSLMSGEPPHANFAPAHEMPLPSKAEVPNFAPKSFDQFRTERGLPSLTPTPEQRTERQAQRQAHQNGMGVNRPQNHGGPTSDMRPRTEPHTDLGTRGAEPRQPDRQPAHQADRPNGGQRQAPHQGMRLHPQERQPHLRMPMAHFRRR